MCWQIGNGSSVRIWQDRWIPTLPSCKLGTESETLKKSDQRVESLLTNGQGSWDVSSIRYALDDVAVEAISSIPIPRTPANDNLRWTLSTNGAYSVKRGLGMAWLKLEKERKAEQDSKNQRDVLKLLKDLAVLMNLRHK
ncbi:hypothetical protein K1719_013929 [Acacia pycnantha]|nr:hypothetical protein K1719_013929 [Acacia pycnantha]